MFSFVLNCFDLCRCLIISLFSVCNLTIVFGLQGKVLGGRVDLCEKRSEGLHQHVGQSQIQPAPKWAKAKPINHVGERSCGIMFRVKLAVLQIVVRVRSKRTVRETALQDTKMSEEGGTRRCFMCQSRDSCAAPEKTMVRQAVPCSLLEDYSGEDLPEGCRGLHTGAGRCAQGSCSLWRAHSGVGWWQELQPRGAQRGAGLLAGLQLMRDFDWSSLSSKNWTLWKGSVLEQGKTEEVAETVLTDCNFHSTCAVPQKGGRRVVSAWEEGEGGEKGGFSFIFVSHYPGNR